MRTRRASVVLVSLALGCGTLLVAPGAQASQHMDPSATSKTHFAFSHQAFATAVTGNPAIHSGATARTTMCANTAGATRHNATAEVSVPGLLDVQGVSTDADTYARRNVGILSHSTIAGATLLDGLIHADALKATVRSWHNEKGFHSTVRTSLAGLTIGGKSIRLTGKNQHIKIPGVATLTVNQQHRWAARGASGGYANVLKIKLADGTLIRVGHVHNRIDGNAPNATFRGSGWGSRVKVGKVVKSGRTAVQPIACVGTRGKVRENTTAGVTVRGIAEISAVRSWVRAAQRPRAHASSNSRIADVSLLGGAITIEGIEAHVQVHQRANGQMRTTYHGTKIGTINVLGVPIDIPTKPNQTINLAGLAKLTFMHTSHNRTGGRVVAAKITLLGTSGATIELAQASAHVRP